MSAPFDISALLPPSLLLPPHLSAHKYFFVCTLTVAAWDTLVLSPRTWKLMKTKEWPLLKIIYHFLRYVMPIEFTIVAVAFFDESFTAEMCSKFFLFEPIVTAVLVSLSSLALAVRVHAIYDKSYTILGGLGILLFIQVAVMAGSIAFFRAVPLQPGQGCITGPKFSWVGIYWIAPTVFYTATAALAIHRSLQSLRVRRLSLWKLMLRDSLNLYGAIWIVNMVNVLFWFIIQPTGDSDSIRTLVSSMAAVLTVTMTLRIILAVRGSLANGGSYAGVSTTGGAHTATANSRPAGGTTHVLSGRSGPGVVNIGTRDRTNGYTIDEMRAKAERDWVMDGSDGKSSLAEQKDMYGNGYDGKSLDGESYHSSRRPNYYAPNGGGVPGMPGVKITIDREVDYHGRR